MTGNHRFDSIQMFRHACAFADCADFCKQAKQSIIDRTMRYTAPKIANAAFACEIFLKTILFYNRISYKREHNLEKLYSFLPDEYKKKIEQECLRNYGTTTDAFGFSYLSNIAESFNEWRYSFEHHHLSIEIGYLYMFCEVLREICCKDLYGQSWEEYRATRQDE